MKYTIKLKDYPPSVNQAYYHIRRGKAFIKVKNQKARKFIETVRKFKPPVPFKYPIKVTVYMYISDKRKRDLDNINKILLDALKKEKNVHYFIEDDDLIHELHMYKVFQKNPKHKTILIIEKATNFTNLNEYMENETKETK